MNWFRRKKAMPAFENIVDTVLHCHTSRGCMFAPGAKERILDRLHKYRPLGPGETIDVLEAEFRSEEIYCPHEGVDRRAEFGLLPQQEGIDA